MKTNSHFRAQPPYKAHSPQRPPVPKQAENGRQLAFLILKDAFEKNEYVSLCLDRHFRQSTIPLIEKRLCTKIVYSVFDNLIQLDHILSFFLEEPDKLALSVRNVLRIGLCQIRYLEKIPDNAAVDESVKLIKWADGVRYAGLVNAVLRKTITSGDSVVWPDMKEEPAAYISLTDSVPEGLARRLIDDYGFETAHRICSFRGDHAVTIRPNMMRYATPEKFENFLKTKVWTCEKSDIWDAWFVRGISNAGKDMGFLNGEYSIEGISSILAAEALDARGGMSVLDCCSAPGGKTAYIAEKMNGSGRIIAWDIHPHRVELIKAMAKRLALDNVRPYQHDALELKEDYLENFDRVLIDAPCTGTGVMDNKPDIKMHFDPKQTDELADIQRKLLETCSRYVKTGGILVYATCSLFKAEGEDRIAAFLREHPEFVLESIPAYDHLPVFHDDRTSGYRILTGSHPGLDGFFFARLRKNRK